MKLKKLLLTLLLLPVFLFAEANLYVFVFKDGNALSNTKIQMGEMIVTTNEYGYAEFNDVKSDTYEISYIKDEQLFALEEVNIVDDQDSQIFLNLVNDKPEVELDLPLEAYSQDFQKVKVKKLEGPKGTLELKLIDSKSKEVVKKAKLFFKGYQLEASSDENGMVKVDIPEGTYDISIVHPNFVMKVLKEIKIVKEKTTSQDVALTKSDIALEEYVVLAPAVEGSLAATFAKLKESDTIGDIMGAEQFSKSGDSSAASALQRVSGVTLVDDKYVYIRGLGERYSTVLLNGLNVPSPNPLKRVVPLDIFPTSILENLIVQKTYSSNLPGNFGGGAVTINTKGIPKEDNYVSGTLGLTYNSSTGKEGYVGSQNNKGLPNEIVQLTDGFKSFGNSDLFTETDKKDYAKELATYRSFNVEKKTIEPGKSVSVSTGQSFKTSSGLKYGFAGNIYYKTSADVEEYTERDYKTSPDGKLTIGGNVGNFSNTKLSEKYGGLVSFGVDNTEGQSIKFTTLVLNQTNDSTTFGLVKETGSNTRVVKRTDLRYAEQEMQLYQLTGENTLFFGKTTDKVFDDVVINWGLEKAIANNNEPGNVQYEYHYYGDVEQNPPYDDTLFKLYTDKPVNYVQTELEDTMTDGKVSLKLPFEYSEQNNFFEIGYSKLKTERTLDSRRFAIDYIDQDTDDFNLYDCMTTNLFGVGCFYDRNQSIDTFLGEYGTNGLNFTSLTPYKPSDYYEATQDILATYFRTKISPIESFDVIVGQRIEKTKKELITYTVGQGGVDIQRFPKETTDTLPELNGIYRLSDDMIIKASYSKSISRPDFRESSPNEYTDQVNGKEYVGYTDLEDTTIDNFDLSFEHFFSFDEMYSISLFKKKFTAPIETISYGNGDSIAYTFRNAKEADSTGVEISFRKKFDFINENLTNYFVGGNFSLIDSKIVVDKNSSDRYLKDLRSKDRAMQGQSPYVYNLNIGYDNINTGRSAIFSYNEFGKRIVSVGLINEGTVDIYEQPFKKLDFTMKWQLNDTYDINEKKVGYTLKFKATNLLDDTIQRTHLDEIVREEKPGQTYTLSLSIKY